MNGIFLVYGIFKKYFLNFKDFMNYIIKNLIILGILNIINQVYVYIFINKIYVGIVRKIFCLGMRDYFDIGQVFECFN